MNQYNLKKPYLFWMLIVGIGFLAMIVIISKFTGEPISRLTRDPLAIMGGRPHLGVVSNMGIIFWSFAAALCLFSSFIMRIARERTREAGFLFFGSVVTVMLLLDDLFMLHELTYPYEVGVFAVYGMVVLFYLLRYQDIIVQDTDYMFLLISLCLFAVSILVDRIPGEILTEHHLFEDGSKYLGIVSWLGYQFSACMRLITPILKSDH